MCEGGRERNERGISLMTCPRCKGSGKFSTGKINGSIDWNLAACKACDGTTFRGELVRQDINRFTNALLAVPRTAKNAAKAFRVIGPIREFALHDFRSGGARIFDVRPDDKGDYLVMLVPRSLQQKPQKAYLVGGIVRERASHAEVSA
jgi:hypothetical protein